MAASIIRYADFFGGGGGGGGASNTNLTLEGGGFLDHLGKVIVVAVLSRGGEEEGLNSILGLFNFRFPLASNQKIKML